jgi:hypothetical protein
MVASWVHQRKERKKRKEKKETKDPSTNAEILLARSPTHLKRRRS